MLQALQGTTFLEIFDHPLLFKPESISPPGNNPPHVLCIGIKNFYVSLGSSEKECRFLIIAFISSHVLICLLG